MGRAASGWFQKLWRLPADDMAVCPAQTESTDCTTSRCVANGLPSSSIDVEEERRACEDEQAIGFAAVQGSRNYSFEERARQLDQPGNAGGGNNMPDVCLYGPECTVGFLVANRSESAAQS